MPKNMSKKTKYTVSEERFIREFLISRISQSFIAHETEEDAINDIIDMYILPKGRKLLRKALMHKINQHWG